MSSRNVARLASALAALVCSCASSAADDAFSKANQEYAAGRFREAIDLYDNVVKAGETSAALFYNIGNAWFRAGDLGQAILNYERALALEPRHPEAQANLRLVRDKARALELPASWRDRVAALATATQYTIVAAASFWVAAFALAALLLSRRRSGTLGATIVLAMIVCAIAVVALHSLETGKRGSALAVVTAKNVEARLATADNANSVLALPPGSEIKILSTRGDWSYAALPNNLRVWIPAQAAERVRLL